jgi:hypothetical protein
VLYLTPAAQLDDEANDEDEDMEPDVLLMQERMPPGRNTQSYTSIHASLFITYYHLQDMRRCFSPGMPIRVALQAQQQRVLSLRVQPRDELLSYIRDHPFRPTTRTARAPSFLTHSAIGRHITVLCNLNAMWKGI